jgi:hypothetical protein
LPDLELTRTSDRRKSKVNARARSPGGRDRESLLEQDLPGRNGIYKRPMAMKERGAAFPAKEAGFQGRSDGPGLALGIRGRRRPEPKEAHMLITRCRQLPDGEELVWDEESAVSSHGFDPREGALARRGQAMAQWGAPRSAPRSDRHPLVAKVEVKVEWR